MSLYAEVRNADNTIVRIIAVPVGYVPPAQKYGPTFPTRLVPVTDNAAPAVNSEVTALSSQQTISAGSVVNGWTQARRPNADIIDSIEDEVQRRLGPRALLFLIRMLQLTQAGQTPTAAQQTRLTRINQIIAFGETLKAQAATLTTISGANWP